MHDILISKLNPDNGNMKYNIHFYILIVAAVRGVSELDVRKDLVKLYGHYDSSSIYRWCRIKKGCKQSISQKDLLLFIKYVNSFIPELDLNSDLLLVETNYQVKRDYQNSSSITAETLGLRK